HDRNIEGMYAGSCGPVSNKVIAIAGTQRRSACRYVVPGQRRVCRRGRRQGQRASLANRLVGRRNCCRGRKTYFGTVEFEIACQRTNQRTVGYPHAVEAATCDELNLAAA